MRVAVCPGVTQSDAGLSPSELGAGPFLRPGPGLRGPSCGRARDETLEGLPRGPELLRGVCPDPCLQPACPDWVTLSLAGVT